MKKYLKIIPLFFFIAGYVYAQNTGNQVGQMDDALRALARDIHRKLAGERAEAIAVGQFTYRNALPPFSAFWANQLAHELSNMQGRSYRVFSTQPAEADWTISGEIVETGGALRVFSRLTRSQNRSIEASFSSTFERTAALAAMLSPAGGEGVSQAADSWEPDSWENPVRFEMGSSENTPVMNRTIHGDGEEDFFLLVPERGGRLVVETTGSTDTYLHLYNYATRAEIAADDDSGQGLNARIRHNVQAGTQYLAKVRGLRSATRGAYGFRAYISGGEGAGSWGSPITFQIGADDTAAALNRTLQENREDFFLLVPDRNGTIVAETSGRLDTYMELYLADTGELLNENDDGGQGLNARIRRNVQAGTRYIVLVRGYSSSASGAYGFRAYFSGQGMLPADQYEPNDEPRQATAIQVGTAQQHTFHSADDVDWVRFEISRPYRYVIQARGARSGRLDTYIELFDRSLNFVAENDDGGEYLDARLSLFLESGVYYLKVWCLGDAPDEPYTIDIQAR